MGVLTLADFESRLQTTLGNRNLAAATLDIWINAGLQELTGAIEFEDLKFCATFPTVAGTEEYGLPDDLRAITAVAIDAEGRFLIKTTPEKIKRLDTVDTTEDKPKVYARRKRSIYLFPIPDAVYTISAFYYADHPTLVNSTDTTILNSVWDTGVHLFAAAQAFLDLGEDARAQSWLARAAAYAGSRITDAEMGSEALTEGVNVIEHAHQLWDQGVR